jgi:hypothetical protein
VEELGHNTADDSGPNTLEDMATVQLSPSNMQKPVGKFTPGRDTMRAFAKYVTERTRSKACVSTYYVRFIEAFAMYARLISQCEKDQEDALTLFDEKFQCPAKRMFIRTKLVPGQAYPNKRKEYRVILNFAKYDLTNHLQLKHEGCNGVGLHCILQGVCGCDTKKDHSKQCADCNKLLRSAHDLRIWLRNRHNDICKAFENILPEW